MIVRGTVAHQDLHCYGVTDTSQLLIRVSISDGLVPKGYGISSRNISDRYMSAEVHLRGHLMYSSPCRGDPPHLGLLADSATLTAWNAAAARGHCSGRPCSPKSIEAAHNTSRVRNKSFKISKVIISCRRVYDGMSQLQHSGSKRAHLQSRN